jgi:[acyl-carrier-protein] S-malonyltransferase
MAKRTLDSARTISVATPDELDKLIEFVSAGMPLAGVSIEGEHLFATERLVVSPAAGVFTPSGGLVDGSRIEVGQVIGHVNGQEVRSSFTGIFQAYIGLEGERVTVRQPMAWLRTI